MRKHLLTAMTALALSTLAYGQSDMEKGINKYREMLADGNPAELFEMNGEELWKTARGPKNATLEKCDLGKGPGGGERRIC
jgi:sulfur-oxidizing protein SoxA